MAEPSTEPDGQDGPTLPCGRAQPRSDGARRLVARFFEPVDVASIAVFRMAFGGLMLVEVLRYFAHGWIGAYFVRPRFHFTYAGFSWVRPWPGDWMYLHFAVLGLLSACIALGRFYRLATVGFFLGWTHVFLIDKANYLNHFYLICLLAFLMIFLPAHRGLSLDAARRPRMLAERVPAWAPWALRAQVGIPYFYGGLAKLNGDWLRGEPMRLWLAERTGFPLIGRFFEEAWAAYVFSYGGLLLDLLIVPALVWRRTRLAAFALAVAFHLLNARLFSIGVFPWLMIAATTIFFDPHWPRWWLKRAARGTPESAPTRGRRWTVAWLALFSAFNLFVPLRHHLYPGDVSWTEQGHRFSWHMKLRDKRSRAQFVASDPRSGASWPIDPRAYLSPRQHREMLTRPDMLRQFCRMVAAREEQRSGRRPEVRARVETSLNGRPHQLLVDPTVDLAAQREGLGPADWIVPLLQPLRPPAPGA
jgi:hypothetical protein